MEYRYTAIVLGKRDVGETDRIYCFYTLENGKMQAIAKGVRKSEARLAGALENFNLIDLSMARSRGMGKITGAILEKSFGGTRNDFDMLSHFFKTSEMVNKFIEWEEKDEKVFTLLSDYFQTLEKLTERHDRSIAYQNKLDLLQLGFNFKLFKLLGYGIEADRCVVCQSRLSLSGNRFYSQLGGTVCHECETPGTFLEIFPNSIKLIRIFLANKLPAFSKLSAERRDINNLKLVQREFMAWNLR